jgi:hypothetical protein
MPEVMMAIALLCNSPNSDVLKCQQYFIKCLYRDHIRLTKETLEEVFPLCVLNRS